MNLPQIGGWSIEVKHTVSGAHYYTGIVFFAHGQICPSRAFLPAPIWRDHHFCTINQRSFETKHVSVSNLSYYYNVFLCWWQMLMETETCFCFHHSLKWKQKHVSVSSCHLFVLYLLSIYGECSYLGSNGTINYSVGASSMPAAADLTYCVILT